MISRALLFALIWFAGGMTYLYAATLADYAFEDPAKTEDFRDIIEELRCLVCQNESLAGSNAELAVDLRNEIYDMMQSGQTKDDVIGFMVERYGDFVLYSPPVKPSTYPIWYGPIILFLIGAALLFRALNRKKQSQETTLSDSERERLHSLLDENQNTKEDKK